MTEQEAKEIMECLNEDKTIDLGKLYEWSKKQHIKESKKLNKFHKELKLQIKKNKENKGE